MHTPVYPYRCTCTCMRACVRTHAHTCADAQLISSRTVVCFLSAPVEGCLWAFAQGVNLRLQFSFLYFAEDNTSETAFQRVVALVMTDHILLSFPQQNRDRTLRSLGIYSQGSCSLLLGATPEYSILGGLCILG